MGNRLGYLGYNVVDYSSELLNVRYMRMVDRIANLEGLLHNQDITFTYKLSCINKENDDIKYKYENLSKEYAKLTDIINSMTINSKKLNLEINELILENQ